MSKLSEKTVFWASTGEDFLFIFFLKLFHINSDRMNRQLSKPEEQSLLVNKPIAKSPKMQK